MNLLQKSLAIVLSCLSPTVAACINNEVWSLSVDSDLQLSEMRGADFDRPALRRSSFYFDGLMHGFEASPQQAISDNSHIYSGGELMHALLELRVAYSDGLDAVDRDDICGSSSFNKIWF